MRSWRWVSDKKYASPSDLTDTTTTESISTRVKIVIDSIPVQFTLYLTTGWLILLTFFVCLPLCENM